MKLKDVLNRLNKRAKDSASKIVAVSEQPKEDFDISCYTTTSPTLDRAIREVNGGFPRGYYTCLTGEGGAGKSSLAMVTAAKMQRDEGRYLVYFDAESTITNERIDALGLIRELTIIIRGRGLEDMLDKAQDFAQSEEVGMIVLDSIPIFVSTAVEQKTAEEYSIGVEAKKFTSRMPIIEGHCIKNKISLVGISHFKLDPGKMGDPRVLPRGEWQKKMMALWIDLTKKKPINLDGKIVGNEIDARIYKSKISGVDKGEKVELKWFYATGFDTVYEKVQELILLDIIKKSGGWYSFLNGEEEIKLQGESKVVELLRDNLELLEHLENLKDEDISKE